MFNPGDIVKIIGTEKIGVAECKNENGTIKVAIAFDSEKYISGLCSVSVMPNELEYATLRENDIRKGYLVYIAQSVTVKSLFDGKGRTEERIPFILKQVEKVWRKYPDMRLGQLLTACSANKLFYMEDNILADKIEEFMEL